MHSIQYTFHDLRYKVEYYKTRYKQRYYSNDRNPRVIQTKLKNQRLLSLRTQPHDKYFIKPGEFLALVPKKLDRNVNQIIEVDTSRYLKSQFLKQRDLFKGYDDNALTENSYSGFHMEQDKYRNIRSYSGSLRLYTPTTDIPDTYKHNTKLANHQRSLLSLLDTVEPNSLEYIYSNGQHGFDPSWNASPLIDLNSISSDINETPLANHSSHYLDRTATSSSSNLFDFENVKVSPIGTSGIPSIASKMQNSSSRRNCSINTDNHRTRVQNSWKLVLNAISLSAAKVSVGLSPKSIHDFENLTPDFINAKSAEYKTISTKRMYNSEGTFKVKERSNLHNYSIQQNRFIDGNIQKYPTISDSISQSHYYNESGFVSIYNYNSDNESSF
ncbi:uncharacterized protein AC631_05169 [Debaryomyces fabryi]|uniref:Uncharacterized protein n=1 Tax=Debaryomyces fabryi TaxID=58627 RepID=A0A0V1PSL3_9ASCO|nr:uncharacterized protein AC631_05169 [Debaryomyces fabryi]KRZ99067.1 hypothetical protein AC631_05169 [Debaryomyces fabryi]CUM47588.1 unnamed protein product [Debaryomyces fabryi]